MPSYCLSKPSSERSTTFVNDFWVRRFWRSGPWREHNYARIYDRWSVSTSLRPKKSGLNRSAAACASAAARRVRNANWVWEGESAGGTPGLAWTAQSVLFVLDSVCLDARCLAVCIQASLFSNSCLRGSIELSGGATSWDLVIGRELCRARSSEV